MNQMALSLKEGIMSKIKNMPMKRKIYDIIFILGYLCCLIPGPFPGLSSVASLLLLMCIACSFFDENFYLYLALFIYLRYRLLLGDTPAYRLYSYLVVLKFLIDIPKIKFTVAHFPALLVFLLHSIFATGRFENLRIGLNVIVDCVLVYAVILRVLPDTSLMRKFILVFMLGGVASGIYGWTNDEFTKAINVSGAGAQTVSRNFGALSDANFAGLFYSLCIICAMTVKKIPITVKLVFIALFSIMLLQTASLSALMILGVLSMVLIILKFRGKSFFILTALFIGMVIAIAIILAVPPLREIDVIAGLIIRITEKLSYIPRGRWDLLTTDRSAIWQEAFKIFASKGLWGKLIGGSVITVMVIDYSIISIACHNSYLQSILNFGIIGTILIYVPLFTVFSYRILRHFCTKPGYEREDIRMLQIIFAFAFIAFGVSVDFFIDWPFMMLYFI